MELTPAIQGQLSAVRAGMAFARYQARVLEVSGPDAGRWLNDLITAGVQNLAVGGSCESLLLDATGRIKAHFVVGRTEVDSFVLVQPSDQPESVAMMLARYVLSSKVTLADISEDRSVVRFTGGTDGPGRTWMVGDSTSPIAVHTATDAEVADYYGGDFVDATDGFDAARVIDGLPRFPTDFAETSVPAEAGWDVWMVDANKGCFLGQESVAKIRNRGRPPFRVVAVHSHARLEPGDPLLLDSSETGVITSALTSPDRSYAIARVRWFEGRPEFQTSDGAPVSLSDPPVNVVR